MKKNFLKIFLLVIIIFGIGAIYILNINNVKNKKEDKKVNEKKYVLSKVTDKIANDSDIDFYDNFIEYSGGFVFNYRDSNNHSKVEFYDKSGKNITNTIYDVNDFDSVSTSSNDDIIFLKMEKDETTNYILLDFNFKKKVTLENMVIYSGIDDSDYIIVTNYRNDKYGVIDKKGNIIIPLEYDYIIRPEEKKSSEYLIAVKNEKAGIINYKNETVVPFEYEALRGKSYIYVGYQTGFFANRNDLFLMTKNGKKGVINSKNEVIIDFDDNISKIDYNEKLDVIYTVNDSKSLLKLYNLEGTFKKSIEINDKDKLNTLAYLGNTGYNAVISLEDSEKNVRILNKNLEFENHGSIYSDATYGGIIYYIYDNMYAKKNSDSKINIYGNDDQKLLNYDFEYVNFFTTNTKVNYVLGCLQYDETTKKSCGFFDADGKVIHEFKYDYINSEFIGFENEYISIYDEKPIKFTLNNLKLEKFSSSPLFDSNHVKYELSSQNDVISDFNGNILIENIYNTFKVFNDDLIIVEKSEKSDEYSYDFYNNEYKKINIINKDKVKIIEYFSSLDSAGVSFVTDKGIYELKVQ